MTPLDTLQGARVRTPKMQTHADKCTHAASDSPCMFSRSDRPPVPAPWLVDQVEKKGKGEAEERWRESERRSSFFFLVANVWNKINKIKNHINKKTSPAIDETALTMSPRLDTKPTITSFSAACKIHKRDFSFLLLKKHILSNTSSSCITKKNLKVCEGRSAWNTHSSTALIYAQMLVLV